MTILPPNSPDEQLKLLEELRERTLVIAQKIMNDDEALEVVIYVHRSPRAKTLIDTAQSLGWKLQTGKETRWVNSPKHAGDVTIFDYTPREDI